MAYVITEKCLGEYNGEPFMVIDPEICIDCTACANECPVDAIATSTEDSPEWAVINAKLAPQWKDNPMVEERPHSDPPLKPGNVLRF